MNVPEPEHVFDLDVDPLLFFAAVIEDQTELLDVFPTAVGMFGPGLASIGEGVAEIARRQVEQAQAALDRLIAEDDTWADCYGTWCAMVPEGTDTNGDEWNRCTVHGYMVFGGAYVCEGYCAPPYVEPTS